MKKTIIFLGILMIIIFGFGCSNHQKNVESEKSILNKCSDSIGMSPCMFHERSLGDTVLPSIKNHTNLITYLTTNYKYPKSAIDNKIVGKIFTQITIESNGYLSDIRILRGLTDDCNDEALKVIRKLQWNPATVKGNPVKFTLVIPMNLKIIDKKRNLTYERND